LAGSSLPKPPGAVLLAVTNGHHCPPSARPWPLALTARTCHQYIVARRSGMVIVQLVTLPTSSQPSTSQPPGSAPRHTW
jgi:hypothetical protein